MRFFARPSFGDLHRGYDPNQPRVPAGNADGGQWTSAGGSGDLDEFGAANRRRSRSGQRPDGWDPRTWWSTAMRALFDAVRTRERLNDMLGDKEGVVVAWTEINGEEVFGVNSDSHAYGSDDDAAARRLRAILIEKYPRLMQTVDI